MSVEPPPLAPPSHAQRNLWSAMGAALVGIIAGGLLFQASALAFDYMKLRGLPLYGNAASLGAYANTLSRLTHEMDGTAGAIKSVIRERTVMDLTIGERTDMAKETLSDARTVLRHLNKPHADQVQLQDAGLNFVALDNIFQQVCPADANLAAKAVTATIEAATPGAEAPVPADAPAAKGAAVKAPAAPTVTLTPTENQAIAPACPIPDNFCENDTPKDTAGARARMICAQKVLQASLRRKDTIAGFSYDAADYLTQVMKFSYPGFAKTDVDNAIRVTGSYRALARKSDPGECHDRTPSGTPTPCLGANRDQTPSLLAPFWDFLLDVPLALLYLMLAFIFGGTGSLANYLYATAAPDTLVATPSEAPWFSVVAGGGAAILTLLLVMAGFQFLTIGASSPDLAYPNPLTVCGLSGVVGLGGDTVLTALKSWISRLVSGGTKGDAT